jgi:signal transduction histidine kinase
MPKTVVFTDTDIEKGKKAIRGIAKEIRNLTKELKAGTLDRKKLQSGLKKVDTYRTRIPHHPCD